MGCLFLILFIVYGFINVVMMIIQFAEHDSRTKFRSKNLDRFFFGRRLGCWLMTERA